MLNTLTPIELKVIGELNPTLKGVMENRELYAA